MTEYLFKWADIGGDRYEQVNRACDLLNEAIHFWAFNWLPDWSQLEYVRVYNADGALIACMIPNYGVEPGEEMIEWLSTMEQEWDGDDSGITILDASGDTEKDQVGAPQDFVFCDEPGGNFFILDKSEVWQ